MLGLTTAAGFAPKLSLSGTERGAEEPQWWQECHQSQTGAGGVRALLQPCPQVPAQLCPQAALLTTDMILRRLIFLK